MDSSCCSVRSLFLTAELVVEFRLFEVILPRFRPHYSAPVPFVHQCLFYYPHSTRLAWLIVVFSYSIEPRYYLCSQTFSLTTNKTSLGLPTIQRVKHPILSFNPMLLSSNIFGLSFLVPLPMKKEIILRTDKRKKTSLFANNLLFSKSG